LGWYADPRPPPPSEVAGDAGLENVDTPASEDGLKPADDTGSDKSSDPKWNLDKAILSISAPEKLRRAIITFAKLDPIECNPILYATLPLLANFETRATKDVAPGSDIPTNLELRELFDTTQEKLSWMRAADPDYGGLDIVPPKGMGPPPGREITLCKPSWPHRQVVLSLHPNSPFPENLNADGRRIVAAKRFDIFQEELRAAKGDRSAAGAKVPKLEMERKLPSSTVRKEKEQEAAPKRVLAPSQAPALSRQDVSSGKPGKVSKDKRVASAGKRARKKTSAVSGAGDAMAKKQ